MSIISPKRKQRSKFTPQDDKKLQELVKSYNGKPNWKNISQQFDNKNARQCRERYKYYLSPDISNMEWTAEEDALLFNLVNNCGKHWASIKKFFPGRSDNMIKNRYNFHIVPYKKTKDQKEEKKEFIFDPRESFIPEEDSLSILDNNIITGYETNEFLYDQLYLS